jgi:hypothetical protein
MTPIQAFFSLEIGLWLLAVDAITRTTGPPTRCCPDTHLLFIPPAAGACFQMSRQNVPSTRFPAREREELAFPDLRRRADNVLTTIEEPKLAGAVAILSVL